MKQVYLSFIFNGNAHAQLASQFFQWLEILAEIADAFLTGEVKHHIALDASYHGVVLLEAGHFATENPGIFALMKALQNAPDIVQWKMHISRSERSAYE